MTNLIHVVLCQNCKTIQKEGSRCGVCGTIVKKQENQEDAEERSQKIEENQGDTDETKKKST